MILLDKEKQAVCWRRMILSVALIAGCVWCVALVRRAYSEQTTKPAIVAKEFKTVAPLLALMHGQEVHFNTIRKLIGKPGPKPKFGTLAEEAWVLAELANVARLHNKEPDFRKWADELIKLSSDLAKTAEAKKLDACKPIAKKINNTCETCHDKYQ